MWRCTFISRRKGTGIMFWRVWHWINRNPPPLNLIRYLTVCNSRCKGDPFSPLIILESFIPPSFPSYQIPLFWPFPHFFSISNFHFKTFSRCNFINWKLINYLPWLLNSKVIYWYIGIGIFLYICSPLNSVFIHLYHLSISRTVAFSVTF